MVSFFSAIEKMRVTQVSM